MDAGALLPSHTSATQPQLWNNYHYSYIVQTSQRPCCGIDIARNASRTWLHLQVVDFPLTFKRGRKTRQSNHQITPSCPSQATFPLYFILILPFYVTKLPLLSPTGTLQPFSWLFITPQWCTSLFLQHPIDWQLSTSENTSSQDSNTGVGFNLPSFKCL